MADIGGLGPRFLAETAPGELAVPRDTGTAPNSLQIGDTGDLRLQPGLLMRGQVLSTEGGNITLQFGEATLNATTELPLQQGQFIDVQVTGQQLGKWTLQLVATQLFTQISQEDVTSILMDLSLPPNDTNVEVAKAMVSMGLPLQRKDIQDLVRNLAQLGREATPQDTTAAVFLKAGALPMTETNVTLLSTFITEHPFIGFQLATLSATFRRLLADPTSRNSMSTSLIDLAEEAPGIIGEFILDPLKLSARKMQQRLQDMAYQTGIELVEPNGGDGFDIMHWLRQLREALYGEKSFTPQMGLAAGLLSDLEESFDAMRLMNAATQGSFYFQIPMRHDGDTAEARLIYHVDAQGRPLVDPDNIVIELLVPTRNLGCVSWRIGIRGGCVLLDAAVEDGAGRAVVQRYLPVLVDRLQGLGYEVVLPTCRPRAVSSQPEMPPIAAPDFETIERVNIQI